MYRRLKPGQRSEIRVVDIHERSTTLVHASDRTLFEAPNWSRDGGALILNADGGLWSLELPGVNPPRRVVFDGDLPELNNDHVLSPDGDGIYMSADDGHIYRGAIAGGAVSRITEREHVWHFLHGVSPDGKLLAHVEISDFKHPGRLGLMASSGGPSTLLDTGTGHVDGPEWGPDGDWIYFNTERWAAEPGHAQLARIRTAGGPVERLRISDSVDWFPHISPTGDHAVYLEFPAGTLGHPADREVRLVVVRTDDWNAPVFTLPLPGGQGTINVNSWAPDSHRFAYVAYPSFSAAPARTQLHAAFM